ncbi:hypothetical protein NON00_14015 [Roseomonas sp. GC11]|nr:hypothetical protein [Roseomonas sp. GC11]
MLYPVRWLEVQPEIVLQRLRIIAICYRDVDKSVIEKTPLSSQARASKGQALAKNARICGISAKR